jgi:hypothetical protein
MGPELDPRSSEIFPSQYAPMFFGPRLVRLFLSLRCTNATTSLSLLPSLKDLCPSLADLKLVYHGDADIVRAISDNVCGWNGLESLLASLLTGHAVTHLSTLASLRKLSFQLDEDFRTQPGASQILPFSSLQDLSIHTSRASTLPPFIARMRTRMVTRISLLINKASTSDWGVLMYALQEHMPHFSMTEIQINGEGESEIVDIPGTVLYPLFSFANLKKLSFRPGSPFAPDDAIIYDLAKAFPRLQDLDLRTSVGSEGFSRVTLAGLVPLVQHCPELRTLGIVVDTSNADLLSDGKLGRGFSSLKIWSLNLGDSRISQPAKVARFLSDIFPSLRTIVTRYDRDGMSTAKEKELYQKCWKEVADLVGHFAEARRQEGLGTKAPMVVSHPCQKVVSNC